MSGRSPKDPDALFRTKVDYDARARATVSCDVCGARAGEPCVGSSGHPVRYTHVGRRRAARLHHGDARDSKRRPSALRRARATE